MGLINLLGERVGVINQRPQMPEISGRMEVALPEISHSGAPPLPPDGPTPPPRPIGIRPTQYDPYPFEGLPHSPIPGSEFGGGGAWGGNIPTTDPYRYHTVPGVLYDEKRDKKGYEWLKNLSGLNTLPIHKATSVQMEQIKKAYKEILENPCLDKFPHLRACLITLLATGVRVGVANSSDGDTKEPLIGGGDFWFVRKHNGVANHETNSISLAKHLFDQGNEKWMTSVLFHELMHLCGDARGQRYHEAEAEILESICFSGQGDQLSTNDYLEQKGAVDGYDSQGYQTPSRADIVEVDGDYWMIFEDFIIHLNTGAIYVNGGTRKFPALGDVVFSPDLEGSAPWKWKDEEMKKWVKSRAGG